MTRQAVERPRHALCCSASSTQTCLDRNFKTAAPVQSLLGRNLLYQMSAQHQWPLEGLDLATAFLQTQPTEADAKLWTTGVQELRDALQNKLAKRA